MINGLKLEGKSEEAMPLEEKKSEVSDFLQRSIEFRRKNILQVYPTDSGVVIQRCSTALPSHLVSGTVFPALFVTAEDFVNMVSSVGEKHCENGKPKQRSWGSL